MALKLRLAETQEPGISHSPKLIRAINLLEKSNLEVQQAINEELESNPMLEESSPDDSGESAYADTEMDNQGEVILRAGDDGKINENADWDSYDPNHSHGWPAYLDDAKRISPAELVSDGMPGRLNNHLRLQLMTSKLNVVQMEIGHFIIENLNEDGFLGLSLQELCQEWNLYLPETVRSALKIIQNFDPIGIGAEDMRECMLIQARRSKSFRGNNCELIIKDHWEKVVDFKWEEIAKDLSVPLSEIKSAIFLLFSKLNPKPGRRFQSEGLTHNLSLFHVSPDVYVYENGHDFRIKPAKDNISVRINRNYNKMFKSEKMLAENKTPKFDSNLTGDAKEYLEKKKKSAQFFIDSLKKRRGMILRLTRSVINHQRDFFETGFIEKLKPLVAKDVAEEVEVDESTVRRIRKRKYIDTPHGIFGLDFFFDKVGLDTYDGGEVASKGVKEMIRKIIASESSHQPYSDKKIGDLLESKYRVKIAPRVITKYRESSGFLSTRKRKLLQMECLI